MRVASLLFMLVCAARAVSSANILAFVPTISKSHYVGFQVLAQELALRGHNVTVVTSFPQDNPPDNVREISVKSLRNVFVNSRNFDEDGNPPIIFVIHIMPYLTTYIEFWMNIFNSSNVTELLSTNIKFDLIIIEIFTEDLYIGITHKFKAPVIGMSTCTMFPWVPRRFGIPANPGYMPELGTDFSFKMNIYQKTCNTIIYLIGELYYWRYFEPRLTDAVRRQFGSEAPSVGQMMNNVSLYFINTHFSLFGARPYPPQVVDVSGLHLRPAKPLPQELDKWMNESSHGVILFSFGSMLRGSTLPKEKVKAFLQVFESLPQRVLWKWEDDPTEKLPHNVRVIKWLPQRDVLAHPKTRVFISHGGLLGTTEAIISGVPMLTIPIYGDQPNNVAAMVQNGAAIHVDYNNITVESLSYALNTLIHDRRYRDNVLQLSLRFLDRPMSPLDTAVYWTEYVIRHRGAPHLRSAAVHMPWYQYYLLDVLALLLSLLTLLLALVYYTVTSCLRRVLPKKSAKLKNN